MNRPTRLFDPAKLSIDPSSHLGRTVATLWLILVGLLAQPATAQQLVKDINDIPVGIRPSNLMAFGDGFLFTAETPETGEAIWISDGTETGTRLAMDLVPGSADMRIRKLTVWNERILFWENTLKQMFVSDGTEAGNQALTGFWQTGEPTDVVASQDGAFFTLNIPRPAELRYTLPGTNTTQKISYDCPETDCGVSNPVIFRDSLYFVVDDLINSSWIWRVGLDGTDPEVVAGPFNRWVVFEGQVDNKLLVLNRDDQQQWGIHAWEPGSPLIPLRTLTEPGDRMDFRVVGQAGGKALMHLSTYAEFPQNRLIATDGTPEGTEIILDSSVQEWPDFDTANLPDGTLLFGSWSPERGSVLWKSDGTAEGTGPIGDIPEPIGLTLVGTDVYFCGSDSTHGEELWKTDGTLEGTVMVAEIYPGPGSGLPGWPVERAGRLFFRGVTREAGQQVMVYDPATDMLDHVTRTNLDVSHGSNPRDFVAVPENSIFRALNPEVSTQTLWSSAGTESSTMPVAIPGVLSEHTNGYYLAELNGRHIWHGIQGLMVRDNEHGDWSGITLPEGWPDANGTAVTGAGLMAFGPRVHDLNMHEVWVTDGTEMGTRMIHASPEGVRPKPVGWAQDRWLIAEDGKLLAVADGQAEVLLVDANMNWRTRGVDTGGHIYLWNENEYGLWTTDGTAEGSRRVNTTAWLTAGYAVIDGDLIYSDFYSGASGRELVRRSHPDSVDVIADIRPGPPGSDPATILGWNDRVLFTARPTGTGRQVWISDGSETGTHKLIDDLAGAGSDDWESRLFLLGTTDTGVVFSVGHGEYGREPWYTNGTRDGTLLLADIVPGPDGSNPTYGGRAGDMILFRATSEGIGPELWGVSLAYLATDTESDELPDAADLISSGFPNPTSSEITFPINRSNRAETSAAVSVSVFDILGRRHRVPIRNSNQGITLDTDRLPAGVYFLSVNDGEETSTRQFVKR